MPNFCSQFLSTQIRSQLWFGLPNTDLLNFDPKYWPYELRSQMLTYRSQILTYFDLKVDPKYWCNLKYWPNLAICSVLCFHSLSTQWHKYWIYSHYDFKISIWDWRNPNPKHWPDSAICCVLYFHTLSTQWLQILNFFGILFSKY